MTEAFNLRLMKWILFDLSDCWTKWFLALPLPSSVYTVVGWSSSCCQNRPHFLQMPLQGTEHEGVSTSVFCHFSSTGLMHVLEKDRWSVTLHRHSGIYISKNKRADVKRGKYTVDPQRFELKLPSQFGYLNNRIIGNP